MRCGDETCGHLLGGQHAWYSADYRQPIGQFGWFAGIRVIYEDGMQAFPARLRQQPIFYPVPDLAILHMPVKPLPIGMPGTDSSLVTLTSLRWRSHTPVNLKSTWSPKVSIRNSGSRLFCSKSDSHRPALLRHYNPRHLHLPDTGPSGTGVAQVQVNAARGRRHTLRGRGAFCYSRGFTCARAECTSRKNTELADRSNLQLHAYASIEELLANKGCWR